MIERKYEQIFGLICSLYEFFNLEVVPFSYGSQKKEPYLKLNDKLPFAELAQKTYKHEIEPEHAVILVKKELQLLSDRISKDKSI